MSQPHLRTYSQTRHTAYTLVLDPSPGTAAHEQKAAIEALYKKVLYRLMPIFCLCIVLNYLDRTSLAFGSIQMTEQLNFPPSVLGLGGGLFFLSYCGMQVPTNLFCMRVGVQRWLAGITLCWGLTATLFAAVRTPWQFYILRLLLGLAEAGSFPGIWYAISLWFPPTRTAVPYSLMNASVAVSQVLAAPIAAALLHLDGTAGLAGWQWVFLGEGLPSIALALALPWLLPDGPDDMGRSAFLDEAELQLLKADRAGAFGQLKPHDSGLHDDLDDNRMDDCDYATESINHQQVARPLEHNPLASSWGRAMGSSSGSGSATPTSSLSTTSVAAAAVATTAADSGGIAVAAKANPASTLSLLLQVAKVWQIWYLAFAEALKGMTVMALMLWLPVMVQSLLSGGDPTQLVAQAHSSSDTAPKDPHRAAAGTVPVLLTAIPFTCAAVLTICLGTLAQKTGRPLLYSCIPNMVGGTAFLAFPWVVHHSRVLGFCMLVIALACGYASSPHPLTAISQLTAMGTSAAGDGYAQASGLALPLYNSIAMLGGFFGPWLLGLAVERLGGFSAGAVAMGSCMVAAGIMVLLLHITQRVAIVGYERVGVEGQQQPTTRTRSLQLVSHSSGSSSSGGSGSGGGSNAAARGASSGKSSSGGKRSRGRGQNKARH